MEEIKLTRENFESEVIQSEKPVLVDFWASWCGPCRMLTPVISEIAKESDGSFKVGKVNVDEERELAADYRIFSIPTLVVFKNGVPVQSAVGARSKAAVLELLK